MATTNQKSSSSHSKTKSSNDNRNNAEIADDLKNVIAEARSLLEATGEELSSSNGVAALREKLDDGLASVKTELGKRREQVDELAERGRSEIERRPYVAVGAALGVGALLGVLLGRRR